MQDTEPHQIRLGLGDGGKHQGLSTFLGVYTPTVLTILGVIMYLRFGWVVGQVGLTRTLFIVLLAHVISLSTTLSLSAVATNSKVGVGGAYYIISRSLGLEIGGSIGFPLFLSQALSVTLYAFGLAESLRIVWPAVPVTLAAMTIVTLVAAIALRGAGAALKIQVPVMFLIALSILALGMGVFWPQNSSVENLTAIPIEKAPFWAVFAVFFPAVTGIMAGVSLSGDLATPQRSIPRGALLAVLTGFVVYLTVPIILSAGADQESLLTKPLIWTEIAVFGPWLIIPGLWGAIFSSAVGSMLGAPRTLQALAMDRLAPSFFRDHNQKKSHLLPGLLVTYLISLLAILLGDLNAVAVVVTMFFLSVYGILNLVAALERLSGNPSWRPTINVHWLVSLIGAFGCFSVMLLIHWPSTLLALAIETGLWLWLKRHIHHASWGDLRRDLYEVILRWSLYKLAQLPLGARNWRPNILVFVRDTEKRLDLVRYASWFSREQGVVAVTELVEGDILSFEHNISRRRQEIAATLHHNGLVACSSVNIVSDVERGILTVAQANGVAGIENNTILLGFPDELERLATFLRVLKGLKKMNRSLAIGKLEPLSPSREGEPRVIHVWWGGLKRNGDLMLLLAYLLTRNAQWRHAKITVMSVASSSMMKEQTEATLARLIPEIRIQAEVQVMERNDNENIAELIRKKSFAADVVFLGLAAPEDGEEAEYAARLVDLVDCLPSCFLVHNGSLFLGELISPGHENEES